MLQKLNYTHLNPVKARLTAVPEQYHYSSAAFYHLQYDRFGFLNHYRGEWFQLRFSEGVVGHKTRNGGKSITYSLHKRNT
jgi:hypothetical protein